MITINIYRIKSFYAKGKEKHLYDLIIDDTALLSLKREDLVELYHTLASFFKEVDKEELV